MRKLILTLIASFALLCSCEDGGKDPLAGFVMPSSPVEKDDPSAPTDTTGTQPGDTTGTQQPANRVPCFIWIDAAANSRDFFVDKANIARDLKLAADAGFTHIIVDVRPTSGDLLFKSTHCQEVDFLGAWVTGGGYQKFVWNKEFDYLQEFIDRGHELGLKVYAGFNTMVAGVINGYFGNMGVCFRDTKLMDAVTWLNTDSGIKPTKDTDVKEYFFNPGDPVAQEYIISLLKDLAAYGKKGLDGILLDRGRYYGYMSDFSPKTRTAFEEYVGETIDWPSDVLPAGHQHYVPSPVPKKYLKWNEYRAKTIHDFMTAAHDAIEAVDPKVGFGVYVGAWYASYYENGVNWASPQYNTKAYYPTWATAEYKNYGFADLCDVLLLGAYAGIGAVNGSAEWTMEGFCKLGKQKTMGDPGILAGGPDVGNWSLDGYTEQDELDAVKNSVTACAGACGGYFLFDMIHLKLKPAKWNYVKQGITAANKKLNNQ